MPPTVSINLCCYNSEKFLEETLRSIFSQTYIDWELVIINDGSTDSTENIINKYIDQGYPIIYHRQKNHGLGHSRNEAIKRSRGQYIAFIDHDDIWLPAKLEKQLPLFNDPDVDLIYANYYQMNEDAGTRQIGSHAPQPRGNVFRSFLKHYPVNLQTVVVRKSSLEKLGGLFDPALNMAEEYDLFMRLLRNGKADYLDTPVAGYRIHEGMGSIQKIDQYPAEIKYVLQKLSDLEPGFENTFRKELQYLRAKIGYWQASAEMKKRSPLRAREALSPFKFAGFVFFALFLLTFVPSKVWRFLVRIHRRLQ
jgi:glycosyltransferase involved in cell wall biosynthesis